MSAPFDARFELYAITDQASALGRSDQELALALLKGGASCLQYRAKRVDARLQWDCALELRRLCSSHGRPFIVNDRVDLALDCGADGVHLGQDDLPVASARRLARLAGRDDLIVGKSTHSLEQALEAAAEGVDYLAYGPLYATTTKENNVGPVGPQGLREIVEAASVPVVAIGGINHERLGEVAGRGALHCAMVSALTGAADVASATAAALEAWRRAKATARPATK